jgi:hypothetical protein
MPTTQLDKEIEAYNRGRKAELNHTFQVLEVCRRLGHIDLETASIIIDYLQKVDRRATEMKEDGE